jgi:hypothetical protein
LLGSEGGFVPSAQTTPAVEEEMSRDPESCHVVAFEIWSCAEKVWEVMLEERTVMPGPE